MFRRLVNFLIISRKIIWYKIVLALWFSTETHIWLISTTCMASCIVVVEFLMNFCIISIRNAHSHSQWIQFFCSNVDCWKKELNSVHSKSSHSNSFQNTYSEFVMNACWDCTNWYNDNRNDYIDMAFHLYEFVRESGHQKQNRKISNYSISNINSINFNIKWILLSIGCKCEIFVHNICIGMNEYRCELSCVF